MNIFNSNIQNLFRYIAISVLVLSLFACTQHHAIQSATNPSNKMYGTKSEDGEEVRQGNPNQLTYASNKDCVLSGQNFQTTHFRVDKPLLLHNLHSYSHSSLQKFNTDLPLSPGDLIDIQIEDGDGFSGRYVVKPDGTVRLPVVNDVYVQGRSLNTVANDIEQALVRKSVFRPATAMVNVRMLHWAPVEVTVSGAVFSPGNVIINETTNENVLSDRLSAFGDFSSKRSLIEALRAASGIRPDAKVDQIIVVRNGWQLEMDLSGVIKGEPSHNLTLIYGDQIIVPTTGCFQHELVKPSRITPKGFRVFMSNLIVPSQSNSTGAVGRYSTNLPYGSRLLEASVSANCVGGTQLTNAPRKVMLASKNPLTGENQVIVRSVEQLMRQAHREEINPYLMPNDAIACYDSDVSNIRDVARTLTEIMGPLKILF